MSEHKKSVLGIFNNRPQVEAAVEDLRHNGFSLSDISVLLPEIGESKNLAHVKGTKAPEGATTGASVGAIIGGAIGLLAGVGMLAIPGVGPIIAAGPIMAALAGLGVGGTVGGVSGALIGLGYPEFEAKRYEGRVLSGGLLLSVHVGSSELETKAKQSLKRSGADDVSATGEASLSQSNSV